jgi:hypothetical protein
MVYLWMDNKERIGFVYGTSFVDRYPRCVYRERNAIENEGDFNHWQI